MTAAENIIRLPQPRRVVPALLRPPATAAVPFESWVEARDRTAAALLGGVRRLAVSGPAGTGKTVLIDHVARVLRAAGRPVSVQLADTDPAPPDANETLFVDEADRLSSEQARRLLQAEGTVVLAGLSIPALRRASGTVHIALAPLEQEAIRRYIAQWLELTGRTPADLDSPAVRRLAELSGGVPRLLATLLAAAAWVAEMNGASTIGADHVEEAAELRSLCVSPAEEPTRAIARIAPTAETGTVAHRRRWPLIVAGGALAAAVLGTGLFHQFPGEVQTVLGRGTAMAGRVEQWWHPRSEPAPAAPTVAAALPRLEPATVPAHLVASRPVVELLPPASPPAAQLPTPVLVGPIPAEPTSATAPAVAATAIAAAPRSVPIERLSTQTLDFLVRRGREMLQLDDVSAARLLFRRAAEGGDAQAMLELGQTYDPTILAGLGAGRLADPAEAGRWYRRAAAAGNARAASLLP